MNSDNKTIRQLLRVGGCHFLSRAQKNEQMDICLYIGLALILGMGILIAVKISKGNGVDD